MHRFAILIVVIASLGCTASLQDVRQQAPAYTGDFPKPYRTISLCIYDRLNSQTGTTPFAKGSLSGGLSKFLYRFQEDPDQRRARIDAMSVGGPPSAEFEITVEPTAATGTSHVEYRRRWGGFWGEDAAAWSVVMECGQHA